MQYEDYSWWLECRFSYNRLCKTTAFIALDCLLVWLVLTGVFCSISPTPPGTHRNNILHSELLWGVFVWNVSLVANLFLNLFFLCLDCLFVWLFVFSSFLPLCVFCSLDFFVLFLLNYFFPSFSFFLYSYGWWWFLFPVTLQILSYVFV